MAPFFSKLLPTLASAYGLQTALAAIFVPQANELWYDLGGGLGFLSTTLLSLYYPSLKAKFWQHLPGAVLPNITDFAPRQILLTTLMTLWSGRLGYFLVTRAIKAGGDSRFDEVKHKPLAFSFFWFAQATWVFVVGLPVYMVNVLHPAAHPPLGVRDYLALSVFATSWLVEIVADHQKSAWRKAKNNKQHDEQFISSGLWSISRHPKYVKHNAISTSSRASCTRIGRVSLPPTARSSRQLDSPHSAVLNPINLNLSCEAAACTELRDAQRPRFVAIPTSIHIQTYSNLVTHTQQAVLTPVIFSYSYVGEVGVWIGLWGLSTASLTSPYAPRFAWVLAGLSPLLTWFLLTKVSGIPPLEVCAHAEPRHMPPTSYFQQIWVSRFAVSVDCSNMLPHLSVQTERLPKTLRRIGLYGWDIL
ncbi:hypothetical protein BC629DRAFT_1437762 [Irpex lacteus]|nr:hypothetical protein BC629DRAFT_1437762 [Irpex lacteus]